MSRRRAAAIVAGLSVPIAAHAGRQPFTELHDNEVLPARVVELQSDLHEFVGTPDGANDDVEASWGAAFGLTHTVELVLNTELAYEPAARATAFTWYGGQLNLRLARPGPPPPPGHIVPLVRIGVQRIVGNDAVEGDLELVLGTDVTKGVRAVAMAGATASTLGAARLDGGLGVLGEPTEGVRVGGEVYGQLPLVTTPGWNSGRATASLEVGPTISVTQGPYWITLGGMAGLGARRAFDGSFHLAWGVEL